jgi:hypothetical protein
VKWFLRKVGVEIFSFYGFIDMIIKVGGNCQRLIDWKVKLGGVDK